MSTKSKKLHTIGIICKKALNVSKNKAREISRGPCVMILLSNYTGYALLAVSATAASTFVCCASLYLKNSSATFGNRA